ncbi:MAG: lytic murein transglycosylase [Duodenibacillus massiliensis]
MDYQCAFARPLQRGERTHHEPPRLTAGATPKNWPAHRKNFVNSQRITLGLNFMKANAASLASAFERWQVPPEIITAVIGVETIYGKSTGNIKTLHALATLSFDYTRRAAFFQNELASFLAICHKNNDGSDNGDRRICGGPGHLPVHAEQH